MDNEQAAAVAEMHADESADVFQRENEPPLKRGQIYHVELLDCCTYCEFTARLVGQRTIRGAPFFVFSNGTLVSGRFTAIKPKQ